MNRYEQDVFLETLRRIADLERRVYELEAAARQHEHDTQPPPPNPRRKGISWC